VSQRRLALVTLGCARNEVDSEELAARLSAGGWSVGTDATGADVVVVNTCGFVADAKQESIDTLLAAADGGAKVVATGCMAERYGKELAETLPEAHAVLGFDHYPDIAATIDAVARGEKVDSHQPRDRRTLLPLTPAQRQVKRADVSLPGHAPAHLRVSRQRLDKGPVAALKLASGCDRRCAFCAIPSFRGAFVSRPPEEVLAEAEWLAGTGVRELVLVSENSTSYGKDLGDLRSLEALLPALAEVEGIDRVRVSYLQPAELRPGLIEVLCKTPGVVPYFDLSFQHASGPVLRRMRRFGDRERFLELLDRIRDLSPDAGVRSNFIVGFPGETEDDLFELTEFLAAARLDAIGVFGYSDEDGTEAAGLAGKVDPDEITRRLAEVSALAEELTAQRAEERIGEQVVVLVEEVTPESVVGRAEHQGPEVDGTTALSGRAEVGDLVRARVTGSEGIDLVAEPV
jgi:ribosomal protein S12 methylthiotransferase